MGNKLYKLLDQEADPHDFVRQVMDIFNNKKEEKIKFRNPTSYKIILEELEKKWWDQDKINHKAAKIIDWLRETYKIPNKKAKSIEYLSRPDWAKTRGVN